MIVIKKFYLLKERTFLGKDVIAVNKTGKRIYCSLHGIITSAKKVYLEEQLKRNDLLDCERKDLENCLYIENIKINIVRSDLSDQIKDKVFNNKPLDENEKKLLTFVEPNWTAFSHRLRLILFFKDLETWEDRHFKDIIRKLEQKGWLELSIFFEIIRSSKSIDQIVRKLQQKNWLKLSYFFKIISFVEKIFLIFKKYWWKIKFIFQKYFKH